MSVIACGSLEIDPFNLLTPLGRLIVVLKVIEICSERDDSERGDSKVGDSTADDSKVSASAEGNISVKSAVGRNKFVMVGIFLSSEVGITLASVVGVTVSSVIVVIRFESELGESGIFVV